MGNGPAVMRGLSQERRIPLTEDSPIQKRCARTKGTWCTDFIKQEPVIWKPAPRGNTECPDSCNGVGRCNYDTGYCDCPAGWRGPGCKTRQKRPCTNLYRSPEDKNPEPMSHIGPDKRDVNWTAPNISPSRCFGVCDDDLALCYCDGPMGRIPAPDNAPPGTPPIRRGRPLMNLHDMPKTTYDGKPVMGGGQPYENVYGPKGYCNVSEPDWVPPCGPEDVGGKYCDEPNEAFCPGACSGHGHCDLGFCRCHEGYYGHDCARRKAGLPLLPSYIPERPWVARQVHEPPAAMEPPPKATRSRPLIYVYDLEPMYQSRLLQYRFTEWAYGAESAVHEYLLMSEHRTFDPEEADYFFVPHYASCLIWPVLNWADYPFFYTHGGTRVMNAVNMLRETVDWINTTYPFWQRRGGRDHIWIFAHDEGSCWAPTVLKDSVWLTHWGRLDLNHTSYTGFEADNYTRDYQNWRQPEGYTKYIEGHPCYDPIKDLVIPAFKHPRHYGKSPLVGATSRLRDIFFYFRGDVGKLRRPNYSRGIRQAIYKMAKEGGWKDKHQFYIGDGADVPGEYTEMLSRSLFCLVAPGDGWSPRMEDAVLHGCIPVIIMDRVHAVFESILDVDSFSVRIAEADIPRILDILKAIPEATLRSKQAHMGLVMHRFRYGWLPGVAAELREMMDGNERERERMLVEAIKRERASATGSGQVAPGGDAVSQALAADAVLLPRPFKGDPRVDDAFATIIQWLYSRIPFTR
ncbi:hypothetical protein GPECTOR_7g915 [Gonium pectorale]|uniref:EGF-like domain-containing protein n=1 Tax=Gonium pectorale TaxID=33097 RepID=A0A150GUC8_GONPE|nr:hypothetical protein GPECTOR_7g915 [Gonium pectorale]|eukprot:KXZ53465.1 hypothetical protein GPECTOR_7g915 [Gonium pectorale]